MTKPSTETMKMSREELIADAVEAMVAKWGEAERAGCRKMAERKHTTTLRMDRAARLGEPMPKGRLSYHIARHANDSGHS